MAGFPVARREAGASERVRRGRRWPIGRGDAGSADSSRQNSRSTTRPMINRTQRVCSTLPVGVSHSARMA